MTRKQSLYTTTLLTALLLAVAPIGLLAGDEMSSDTLEFKAHNKIYNAAGSFKKWRVTRVDLPDGDLTKGTVELEVDLASVWEKAAALADHLRTSDFFDVAKYTTATVKIDRALKTGENTYKATATVVVHGNTGEVPVEFEVTGENPLTIKGSAVLNRTAFGIGGAYDGNNEKSIVEQVEISLTATLTE